jgi:hypothetical protein
MTKIAINENWVEFAPVCITYEEVITLAGLTGSEYVVTYRSKRDGHIQREGRMKPGCAPVLVTDVMMFSVAHTGNA